MNTNINRLALSVGTAALLACASLAHAQSTATPPSTSPSLNNNRGSETGPTPRSPGAGVGTTDSNTGNLGNRTGTNTATPPATSPGMNNNRGSETGPTPRSANPSGTGTGMDPNASTSGGAGSMSGSGSGMNNSSDMGTNRSGSNADGSRRARADRN